MKPDRPHSHPCQWCRDPVPCYGIQRPNDGFPEVVCEDYHLEGGTIAFLLCEFCTQEAQR